MKPFLLMGIALLLASAVQADEKSTIVLKPDDDFPTQLAAAVAAVNTGQTKVLAFAPGEFLIEHPIEFRLRFGHPGLRIRGAGAGITRLVFKEVEAGLRAHLDTGITRRETNPALTIDDLSLIASGTCGTAIDLLPGAPDHRGGVAPKSFRNLTIEGKNGTWRTGIRADDLAFCTFRDITLRLAREDCTGIYLSGKSSPVDHHFDGIRILGGSTGIRVTGTVEGVYLNQITMIGTDIGIDWDTESHEPLLALSGSHINARSCCVRANHLLQALITGNLFYQADPKLPWSGITIRTARPTAYDLHQISNNTFHGHPKHSENNTGLDIAAASSAVIAGNIFSALDTGIRLGQQATELKPSDSVFKDTTTEIAELEIEAGALTCDRDLPIP